MSKYYLGEVSRQYAWRERGLRRWIVASRYWARHKASPLRATMARLAGAVCWGCEMPMTGASFIRPHECRHCFSFRPDEEQELIEDLGLCYPRRRRWLWFRDVPEA